VAIVVLERLTSRRNEGSVVLPGPEASRRDAGRPHGVFRWTGEVVSQPVEGPLELEAVAPQDLLSLLLLVGGSRDEHDARAFGRPRHALPPSGVEPVESGGPKGVVVLAVGIDGDPHEEVDVRVLDVAQVRIGGKPALM
jgi:hypothetical protein